MSNSCAPRYRYVGRGTRFARKRKRRFEWRGICSSRRFPSFPFPSIPFSPLPRNPRGAFARTDGERGREGGVVLMDHGTKQKMKRGGFEIFRELRRGIFFFFVPKVQIFWLGEERIIEPSLIYGVAQNRKCASKPGENIPSRSNWTD